MSDQYRNLATLPGREFASWGVDADSIARHIADTIPYILYVYDLSKARSVYSNRQLGELLGYSSAEVKGIGPDFLSALLHPDDSEALGGRIEQWMDAGDNDILEFQYRLRHKGGEWRWFLSRNRIFARDETGRVTHIIGSGEDITDRKRAFEVSEQRFRLLADNLPGIVFLCKMDAKFTILYVNDGVEAALGYPKEEVLSGRVSLFELVHAEDRRAMVDTVRGALARRESFQVSYRLRHASGEWRWFDEFGVGVFDQTSGELLFLEGFCHDVTERVRGEEERRRLEAQMQHTQKLESLGLLAGGIAHDFNNLLMGIMGNAALGLDDLCEDSPLRQVLGDIVDSAERASGLCNQLLAYSGKGKFIIKGIDLSRLVQDMVRLLEVSVTKKARLRVECAESLPAVEGDASQLQQVAMNLILNASDALEEQGGVITVRTSLKHCTTEMLSQAYTAGDLVSGDYVCFEVCDDGPGMDEGTRERIFDPFFTTKFTGRGLGLAAVLGIIHGHGGAILVESAPGSGAVFRVLLPVSRRAVEQQDAATANLKYWRGQGTVLVIDDETQVLELARKMLKRAGFSVVTARDGLEGLRLFREHGHEVAFVLLDMVMPHMGGDEVLARLRSISPGVRVILTSGFSEADAIRCFDGRGRTAFIQKPYTQQALYKLIRRLLDEPVGATPR